MNDGRTQRKQEILLSIFNQQRSTTASGSAVSHMPPALNWHTSFLGLLEQNQHGLSSLHSTSSRSHSCGGCIAKAKLLASVQPAFPQGVPMPYILSFTKHVGLGSCPGPSFHRVPSASTVTLSEEWEGRSQVPDRCLQ